MNLLRWADEGPEEALMGENAGVAADPTRKFAGRNSNAKATVKSGGRRLTCVIEGQADTG